MNEIKCEECKYGECCPVMWSYNNAVCLTIRKQKEKKDESENL